MEKNNQNEEFLQSAQWSEFQQAVGRKTFHLKAEGFSAFLIEHTLPIVGSYLYCPRGPILDMENKGQGISEKISGMLELAKKENAGWIRIDADNMQNLELFKERISAKIVKAPHDMQPKEVFVINISKDAEILLNEMKPKTRYNINLAKKKGVDIKIQNLENKYVEDFLRLTKEMAARQGITAHPGEYYRKMIESLPEEMLKIYVAEFEGKVLAANLVLFYGTTATYLHGASSNDNRNVMAPFLLQWQAILDAKEKGCMKYDFGGVKTNSNDGSWAGITQFKLGFSPNTVPVEFPGSYDIVINPRKYAVYRGLQRAKAFAVKFRK
jgi:peptidoglycan pentaglycine glycine transferase (the first glycine)